MTNPVTRWWKGVIMRRAIDIAQGQKLPPWWYGRAWFDWNRQIDVFLPIPINLAANLAVRCHWAWNRWRSKDFAWEKAYWNRIHEASLETGRYREHKGRRDMLRDLNRLHVISTRVLMVLEDLELRKGLSSVDKLEGVSEALLPSMVGDQLSTGYPHSDAAPSNGGQKT